MSIKHWEIECETDVEKRWFEVEAENEDHAAHILYDLKPEVELILYITEVKK